MLLPCKNALGLGREQTCWSRDELLQSLSVCFLLKQKWSVIKSDLGSSGVTWQAYLSWEVFCPWKHMLCAHTGRIECVSVALVQFRGRWRTAGALQGIATWQEHTYSKTNRFAQYFYESLSSAGSGSDDLPSPREAAGGRLFQLSLYLGTETWVTSSQSWRESPWATCHV